MSRSKHFAWVCGLFVTLFFVTLFFVTHSATVQAEQADRDAGVAGLSATTKYVPIFPKNFLNNLDIFELACTERDELGKTMSDKTSNADRLRFYPNESMSMYLEEFDRNGRAGFAGIGLSAANKSYRLTIDYLKYRTDYVEGVTFISGVGARLHINLTTAKKGLNLANLFALSLGASSGEVTGQLEFGSLGVSGPEITSLSQIPTSFSQASVSAAIQSIAALKAKIYAPNTKIWPQIVGVVGLNAEAANALIKERIVNPPASTCGAPAAP